jgi:hypothetical protein
LGIDERRLFDQPEFVSLQQEPLSIDFAREIKKLPYVFEDPVRLDKKIDPRKLLFGSKIAKSSGTRENYSSMPTS